MSKENTKDFNKMLTDNKNMPKIQIVKDNNTIKKYGGSKMLLAPPMFYDELMRKVPYGKLVTIGQLRKVLAKYHNADFTDPMTAGIFVNIVAWASFQRSVSITPYWRTIKSDGQLNEKYPKGLGFQKELLEKEGHIIITKGIKNKKYYIKNYEQKLIDF